MSIPVTIAAVHLLADSRRTLCGLAKSKVDQWCPVGMWPAVKADHQCPLCDSAYGKLTCIEIEAAVEARRLPSVV
jgi:hypothetical protein